MPLDANKASHIQTVILRTFQGRQKTVVFVTQTSGGGNYIYTAVQVILRPQAVIDPEIPNALGMSSKQLGDMLLIAPIDTNFTGVVLIADTATATAAGVAAALKYQIVEARPVGIVPGGNRYVVKLKRFR
jgi:hypothetical protein